MIEHVQGDLLRADAEAIVNTVNCVGHMGRGIALQFKKHYPDNYSLYRKACDAGEVVPGRMFVFETGQFLNPRFIINFPTKRHWRGKSKMEDIQSGLRALVGELKARKIRSIAIPPLGCGLGGLDWSEVRPLIESSLADVPDLRILLYAPTPTGAVQPTAKSHVAPEMTPGRAALIALMDRYLAGVLDPFVSLLEVHKLMYFAQEAGQPLRLNFKKAHYGPYAENLRHVLSTMEGHFVTGYADGGDEPTKQLELVPGAIEAAKAQLEQHPDALGRFERISQLVDGFESPFGLELLATVHWVAKNAPSKQVDEIVRGVRDWGKQKDKMSDRQIHLALARLRDQGWLSAQP